MSSYQTMVCRNEPLVLFCAFIVSLSFDSVRCGTNKSVHTFSYWRDAIHSILFLGIIQDCDPVLVGLIWSLPAIARVVLVSGTRPEIYWPDIHSFACVSHCSRRLCKRLVCQVCHPFKVLVIVIADCFSVRQSFEDCERTARLASFLSSFTPPFIDSCLHPSCFATAPGTAVEQFCRHFNIIEL